MKVETRVLETIYGNKIIEISQKKQVMAEPWSKIISDAIFTRGTTHRYICNYVTKNQKIPAIGIKKREKINTFYARHADELHSRCRELNFSEIIMISEQLLGYFQEVAKTAKAHSQAYSSVNAITCMRRISCALSKMREITLKKHRQGIYGQIREIWSCFKNLWNKYLADGVNSWRCHQLVYDVCYWPGGNLEYSNKVIKKYNRLIHSLSGNNMQKGMQPH